MTNKYIPDDTILDFLDEQFDRIINLALILADKSVTQEVLLTAGSVVTVFAHAAGLSKEQVFTLISSIYDATYPEFNPNIN